MHRPACRQLRLQQRKSTGKVAIFDFKRCGISCANRGFKGEPVPRSFGLYPPERFRLTFWNRVQIVGANNRFRITALDRRLCERTECHHMSRTECVTADIMRKRESLPYRIQFIFSVNGNDLAREPLEPFEQVWANLDLTRFTGFRYRCRDADNLVLEIH